MTGRTHDLAAFTALSFIIVTHPLPTMTLGTAIAALGANMIGGIAPDIDQPTAPLWRNLPIGKFFGKVFDRLLGGHRFLSHSLLGAFLFGVLFQLILTILHPSFPKVDNTIVWWSFMIGFMSHLVMDTITKEGVPWLLPIPWSFGFPPIKAFRVSTGKFVELYIVFPSLLILTGYIYYSHYATILALLHHYLK